MLGEYSSALGKMVYLKHRSFLPASDELRSTNSGYPNRREKLENLVMKTTEYVNEANTKYAAATSKSERIELTQSTGCKGTYSLSRLPNHDRLMCTPVEPMHVLKNVSEHLVSLLTGRTDTIKVRMEEKLRNRFRSSWVGNDHGARTPLPPAPFRLTKDEIKVANLRCVSIKVPTWVDWKHKKLFVKTVYVKSVEWKHVLTSGILKFCVRGCLGKKQRSTLFELCDVLSDLCCRAIDVAKIDTLEYRLNRVLSLLERDYPVSIHVIMFHLLHHLPMFVKEYGPIHNFWMFAMERFNSWISNRVKNRRYPESTVMETYKLFDLTSFFQLSNQLPTESSCDVEPDEEDSEDKLDICTQFLSGSQIENLDQYYQIVMPEYSAIIQRYLREKETAQREGCVDFPDLSSWYPIFGSDLTTSEEYLRKGPTRQITKANIMIRQHQHGRYVKYSSAESDNPNSGFSSSYVCIKPNDPDTDVVFGRIQFLFEHTFHNVPSKLAYVHWFHGCSIDSDSGLRMVNIHSLSTDMNPIITLDCLSPPLIHALDSSDTSKLWILNYHHSLLL